MFLAFSSWISESSLLSFFSLVLYYEWANLFLNEPSIYFSLLEIEAILLVWKARADLQLVGLFKREVSFLVPAIKLIDLDWSVVDLWLLNAVLLPLK